MLRTSSQPWKERMSSQARNASEQTLSIIAMEMFTLVNVYVDLLVFTRIAGT